MYVETYETSSQTILFSNKPRFYCHVCYRSLCAMANVKKWTISETGTDGRVLGIGRVSEMANLSDDRYNKRNNQGGKTKTKKRTKEFKMRYLISRDYVTYAQNSPPRLRLRDTFSNLHCCFGDKFMIKFRNLHPETEA